MNAMIQQAGMPPQSLFQGMCAMLFRLPYGRGRVGRLASFLAGRRGTFLQSASGFYMHGMLRGHQYDSMLLCGLYETGTAEAIRRIVKRQKCFIDVGANIGYFTMVAKAADPRAVAIAVEPGAAAYASLTSNLARNGFAVETHQLVLGSASGRVEFEEFAVHGVGSGVVSDETRAARLELRKSYKGLQIENGMRDMVRLDDLVGARPDVDGCVIKMDAEGYEHEILLGAAQTLPRTAALIIERNDACLAAQNVSWRMIEDLLAGHGFAAHYIWDLPLARKKPVPASQDGNYIFLRKGQGLQESIADLLVAQAG